MLPDESNHEEVDPIETEFIIPGLPFLSKNLAVGRGTRPSLTGKMDRDLALYDRKSNDFYEKIIQEARLGDRAELKSPDPLIFWLAQVCLNQSVIFLPNLTPDVKASSNEFLTALPALAQDILAIPATSVPSERMFSISGILSENRRSRITPENLENRVLIKSNKIT